MRKTRIALLITAILCSALFASPDYIFQNARPGFSGSQISSLITSGQAGSFVRLTEVPTSRWTYGCSATAAGMMFGYYDRTGYSNMYTGPANGGIAPLYDLGARCSIIATQKGFDGRETWGHVDNYWITTGASGPDPFEGVRPEHAWGDCVADFMGTNQAKWDWDEDGFTEFNTDGSTALWTNTSGRRLYDYLPPESGDSPRTALSHGLRLFAESRGYDVVTNYTQQLDTLFADGFSFADYKFEIDAGRPVMVQLRGHSMLGVGYDEEKQDILFHNTWDNALHTMPWGGTYEGMEFFAVTVFQLAAIPEPASAALWLFSSLALIIHKQKKAPRKK